ncbi:solute carrier family 45 member 3 [Latimeria chalumnae]|uniref:Solute carrier family 45 member 3 n=1 Tax=Latimeria chalumnae TaxID=7897 RepID=H3A9Q2_LATCH|nr:PREDICTED: solute carrier family 45 member 3 [Latimeria chalumnae]|eukprot:XP_006010975.1 PREDICTED: solute carrier family 45 member 3 [Latimeria chalumnae]
MVSEKAWVSMLFHNRKSQILLVNSLCCGLEICLATGVTYIPPLLLEAGVEEKFMTMVLGIGPVLGLIFVPLIGSASDHWTSSFGRRRPFIWILCLGVLLSLFIIPHANTLALVFKSENPHIEKVILILGVCLLDFCGQVCFTPLEALLSDLFRDIDNCRHAFSMYSFMVSLGGCIGYLLPAIDLENSFLGTYLGRQEECLFMLLAIIFVGCVLLTVFVSEEVVVQAEVLEMTAPKEAPRPPLGCYFRSTNSFLWIWHLRFTLRSLCTLAVRFHSFCCQIPRVIWQLFMAELWSWMALMTFILFYTDFVGEGLYYGVPSAEVGSVSRLHYEEGVRVGSLGLFLHCAVSIFFSTIMDWLVKKFGTRAIYLASMGCFTLAAFIICLSQNVVVVTAMAALTGFTYSTLQILPYTLASLYHNEKQVFFRKCKYVGDEELLQPEKKGLQNGNLLNPKPYYLNEQVQPPFPLSLASGAAACASPSCEVLVLGSRDSKLPASGRGICLDLAILDSAFLLSQVVPSLFMGTLVQFMQSVTAYMVSAVLFGLVAIYFATKIIFDKNDLEKYLV